MRNYRPLLLSLALAVLSISPLFGGSFRITKVFYEVLKLPSPAEISVSVGARAVYEGVIDPDDDGWELATFIDDDLDNDLTDLFLEPGNGLNGRGIPFTGYAITCDPLSCGAGSVIPKCDQNDHGVAYLGRGAVAIFHLSDPDIHEGYGGVQMTRCDDYAVRGRVVPLNPSGRLRLQDPLRLSNNGNDFVFAKDAFEFPQKLKDGDPYDVQIVEQPQGSRRCSVDEASRSGVIDGQDVEVLVRCAQYCKATQSLIHYPGNFVEAGAQCVQATLVDNGNGTVSDSANDLLWMKTPDKYLPGNTAQLACGDIVLAGQDAWYLPDVAQLQTLLPPGTCHSVLDDCGTGDPDTPYFNGTHWSSSHPYFSEYCEVGACHASFWTVATGLGQNFGVDCNIPLCPPRERVYWWDVTEPGDVRCVADLNPGDSPASPAAANDLKDNRFTWGRVEATLSPDSAHRIRLSQNVRYLPSSGPGPEGLEPRPLVPRGQSVHRSGSTVSNGATAIHADVARQLYGVDGSGVTVGVISDSFDCLQGAAADLASGDIPSSVRIVAEASDCLERTDEGRAIIQIVADVAPGATPLFHTASRNVAGHIQAISSLAAEGVDVIVDHVRHFDEPMFQDGSIAQAIDNAVASGIVYVSAAGEVANHSYEGSFQSGGTEPVTGREAHDWAAGTAESPDLYQRITVPEGSGFELVLQWDQPFPQPGQVGSSNDMDVWLLDNPPTQVIAAANALNARDQPIEGMAFYNPPEDGIGTDFNLVISRFSGPAPAFMKYVLFDFEGTVDEYFDGGSTIYGGPNAAGALTVGSAAYYLTPNFGIAPPGVNSESSRGGTPILFDVDGEATVDLREKPDILCVDDVNNTFFGVDTDNDGFPNMSGTAAAAAHVGGIVALMLELLPDLTPGEIYEALRKSALDTRQPGFDQDSGYGLCQADAAIKRALPSIFSDGFESGETTAWSEVCPDLCQ